MSPVISGGGTGGGSTPTLSQVLTTGNSAGASTVNMNSNKITGLANGTATTDAAAFGQIPINPAYGSGVYYFSAQTFSGLGNETPTLNVTYAVRTILAAGTLVRIGIPNNTGGGAGSVIRLGIWNESSGLPGSLLLDCGTVASTGTGGLEATISQSITQAGYYWVSATAQVGTVPTWKQFQNNAGAYVPQGTTAPGTGNPITGVSDSNGWTGALGTPFGAVTYTNAHSPAIFFRY